MNANLVREALCYILKQVHVAKRNGHLYRYAEGLYERLGAEVENGRK